jgi:hypothetical protein
MLLCNIKMFLAVLFRNNIRQKPIKMYQNDMRSTIILVQNHIIEILFKVYQVSFKINLFQCLTNEIKN